MDIAPFKLERFFAQHEFSLKYQMSSSDCDTCTIQELISLDNEDYTDQFMQLSLGYTEAPGKESLRKSISHLYQAVTEDEIVVAAPQELIFLGLNALLEKGDEVITLFPLYQSLLEIPESLGCQITRWPLHNSGDRWQLDLNFLEHAISSKTKAIILNFPHNPTGFVPKQEELSQIIAIARHHGIVLFSDEMYHDLEYFYDTQLTPMVDLYEKGISLSGLSKSYGLPGLRIGWLVSKDQDFLYRVKTLKDYTTICNSAPSEFLAEIALKKRKYLINKSLDTIRKNYNSVSELFGAYNSILHLNKGEGGSVLFPYFTNERSAKEVAQDCAQRKKLLLVSGDLFDMPHNYFRIGLGRDDLPQALEQFSDYLASL